jgi:nitrile hydratase
MNGIHDLGGMHGFGPMVIEPEEPLFHAYWASRVFALRLACGFHRKWNADMGRYARECMPPAKFLSAGYYERGLYALEQLLVASTLINARELESGHAETKTYDGPVLQPGDIPRLVRSRRQMRMDVAIAPHFKVGDRVVARNINPVGHTRMPRYVRGRRGMIDRDHGVFTFADTHAMTRDKKPQHLYSVRFAATELWGEYASERDSVYVDLWDDHLKAI